MTAKILSSEDVMAIVYDRRADEGVKQLAKSHETLRAMLEATNAHVDTAHEALTKIKRRSL